MKSAKFSTSTILLAIAAFMIVLFWFASNQSAQESAGDATPESLVSQEPASVEPSSVDQGLRIFHMTPENAIAAALGYYCASAPTNASMWLPFGSTGIYQAVSISTGEAFSLKLSPASKANTTDLSAYDVAAQQRLSSWGCPAIMPITVLDEDE